MPTAPLAGNERLGALIAAATLERMAAGELWPIVNLDRGQALQLSVVNRARDLFAGTLSLFPFTRSTRRGVELGGELVPLEVGWLERPDPDRTRGAWVAELVDELFFHGWAAARVTARGSDGYPTALKLYPWAELIPPAGHPGKPGGEADWWRWTPANGPGAKFFALNMVTFESPLSGVLTAPLVLETAARLGIAARRFASTTVPMGWLAQKAGTAPLDAAELTELATEFATARELNAIAALNEAVEYHESQLDPGRLQLVEGRSYQDAALARVCNVPGFMVGATVPGDSMVYRTALTARWDLIDFGLAPLIGCICETLSGPDVTPRGQIVGMDPSPFLHASELAGERPAAPAPTTEASHA